MMYRDEGSVIISQKTSRKDVANSVTKIKICGLTSPREAEWLNEVQADFAGMVLYFPKSKRNITLSQAEDIMKVLHHSIKRVAVVVSPTPEQIRELQTLPFDYIQIHGKVLPQSIEQLEIPFLRAFNVENMQEYEIYEHQKKCAGYVFDAVKPGSGKTFDWSSIPSLPSSDKFYLLAGGLSSENVAHAIELLHPDGVDVSSGVESATGAGKDLDKIRSFVKAVRNGS
jgi:phosphoribosylanthranilate isomerase